MPEATSPFDVLNQEQIDQLQLNADGSIVWPLRFPITTTFRSGNGDERGETTAGVTVRRPKGKHLRQIKRGSDPGDFILTRIADLTGLEPKQTDDLDQFDIMAISDIIESFSQPAPAIGKTS